MFKLAHLSDPHLALPSTVAWRSLASKRVTGYLSWRHKRKHIHDRIVLTALSHDIDDQMPDHIVVTGDLTNLALPEEFERALDWLNGLGSSQQISIIPGNHDAYVTVPWSISLGRLAPFMAQDDVNLKPQVDFFPYVRRIGPLAIIGVSSAVPMPFFVAAGMCGQAQLNRLASVLTDQAYAALLRVVLIHHPPVEGLTSARKGLRDAAAFQEVIAQAGAELILHGHNHRFSLADLPTPTGTVPVIGVPSASALAHGSTERGSYHIYHIERRRTGWQIELEIRGYDHVSGAFVGEGKRQLVRLPADTTHGRTRSAAAE